MSTDVIYTATDLKERRREVLEAAQRDRAVVRAVDGTALIFMPMQSVQRMEAIVSWAMALSHLQRSAHTAHFPWLRHLDADDRATFLDEAFAALDDVAAGGDLEDFQQLLTEWRVTATALADGERRGVLLGAVEHTDFEPVDRFTDNA